MAWKKLGSRISLSHRETKRLLWITRVRSDHMPFHGGQPGARLPWDIGVTVKMSRQSLGCKGVISNPHPWKEGGRRRIGQKEKSDCNPGLTELQPIRDVLHWV